MTWYPADIFIMLLVSIITLVDVLFVVKDTPTASRRMRAYGYRIAAAPFAWGALAGHFWGPHTSPPFGTYFASAFILTSCCLFVAFLHRLSLEWFDLPDWFVLVYAVIGIPTGAFAWPQ